MPYLIGWMLGVPVIVLVILYLIFHWSAQYSRSPALLVGARVRSPVPECASPAACGAQRRYSPAGRSRLVYRL